MCGGPSLSHACVVCGETQWSFGGPEFTPNESLIKGIVWSCGGCCAFLPYLPPTCSRTIASRDAIIHNTPMYCGDVCQEKHWFDVHHDVCRRDDMALYGYTHLVISSLHGFSPAPFGRRVERDGEVSHMPHLVSLDRLGARYCSDGGVDRLV